MISLTQVSLNALLLQLGGGTRVTGRFQLQLDGYNEQRPSPPLVFFLQVNHVRLIPDSFFNPGKSEYPRIITDGFQRQALIINALDACDPERLHEMPITLVIAELIP